MRTHDGYDAQDSYECAGDAMGENVRNGNDEIKSNGRRFQEKVSDSGLYVMHLTVVLLTRLQNHKHLQEQYSRWYNLVSKLWFSYENS